MTTTDPRTTDGAADGAAADLLADVRDVYLGNLGTVEADLELPAVGPRGARFTWRSGEPLFLAHTGAVNRPSLGVGNRIVPLHLTAVLDGRTLTRTYDVTVLEEESQEQVAQVPVLDLPVLRGTPPVPPAFVPTLLADGVCSARAVRWTGSARDGGATVLTGTVEGTDLPARCRLVPVDVLPGTAELRTWQAGRATITAPATRVDPGSRFGRAQRRVLAHLRSVDPDRLLASFRTTAGLDTRGAAPMTGWDSPSSKLRGHTTGHYLSALALAVRATGDPEVAGLLRTLVDGLARCQQALDARGLPPGYLGAYDEEQFDLLERGAPYPEIWAPYYTLDKVLAGLLDAEELGGVAEALPVAAALGGWVHDRLDQLPKAQRDAMWSTYIAGEFGGLMSALVRLAARTGEERLLGTARHFVNDKLVVPLSAGYDPLGGMHANQHIPQAIGALDLATATGDPVLGGAAAAFWRQVTAHHLYAIGGTGETEMFRAPDRVARYLTDKCAETCATHNMLRLTAGLFRCAPDASAMDYYERALLNHLATTFSPREDGGSTYFLSLMPGARKAFDTDENTCCHGTGLENAFRFTDQVVSVAPDRCWVNLYLPAAVDDPATGVRLTLVEPVPGSARLTVHRLGSRDLHLRVPHWAERIEASRAGRAVEGQPGADGYLVLAGPWQPDEQVEVRLVPRVGVERCPDDPTLVAVTSGPYVLAARTEATTVLEVDLDRVTAAVRAVAPGEPVTVDGVQLVPVADLGEEAYQVYLRDRRAGAGRSAEAGPDAPWWGRVPTILPW